MSVVRTAIVLVFTIGMILTGVSVGAAQTQLYPTEACGNTGDSDICTQGQGADITPLVQGIVNILLYIAGAVSVFFILFAGFKFITSAGDASKAASARNTLLYAVIGLIVVVLSYAIANFVVDRIIN